MPELPEVETTKASLMPLLGQTVHAVQVFQPKLRWPMPNNLVCLVGYSLQNVERRAKYLILTFKQIQTLSNEEANSNESSASRQLIMHLGMSGSLQQYPYGTEKRKHDHLILQFSGDTFNSSSSGVGDDKNTTEDNSAITQLHFHDPRRFGAVLWYDEYKSKLFDHLGLEPLSSEFNAEYLYKLIQRTNDYDDNSNSNITDLSSNNKTSENKKFSKKKPIARPIKSVIMEQQVVVGVGNIYAAESLYLSAIHPATPANSLTYKQIVILVDHIKSVLKKSIMLGGSTLRDFTVASGQTGYFQQTLNVYGRQGEDCPSCSTTLDNIKLNGRASVFCPKCQPL